MTAEVLINYDEIGLKGKNRPFFEQALCRNVRLALETICPARVNRAYGRVIAEFDDEAAWPRVRRILARVYGIAHFARVWQCEADLEAMQATALAILPHVPDRSFAVRANRGDDSSDLRSRDMACAVGSAIQGDRGWDVDLDNPDITIYVTTLRRMALLSYERFRGSGGLPAGVSAKVACLLSGGIDSPVAAHRIMRRGAVPVFIHFHSYPYTEKSTQETARRLAEHLLYGQPPAAFWLVPLGEIQQEIVRESPPDLRVLLYRRFMMRLAAALARQEGAQALVTGEVLGQVASQTLENMAAIAASIDLPVVRPLIGFDKREIITAAGVLGTIALSGAGGSDCCSYLLPAHPATKACDEDLTAAERALSVDKLIRDALDRAERSVLYGRIDEEGGATSPA